MKSNRVACAVVLAVGFLGCAVFPSSAVGQMSNPTEPESAGSASLVVTAEGKGSRSVPVVQQKDVTALLRKHAAQINGWEPFKGAAGLQLVFLFDESAPSYLALQIPSLRKFIEAMPPSAEVAVAYMSNGQARMAQTLTRDHALAAKSLRLTNGMPGISASPYFCLSDLAKRWPSDAKTRRVVFMVTNGEDPYYRAGDLQDPYVAAAISDSQKAALVVYSIYFRDNGFRRSGSLGVLYGQSYLQRVSSETGGQAYAEALSSPVSFDPYLKRFKTSLDNQYRLTITAQGSGLQPVTVKSTLPGVKLHAATRVDLGSQR